MPGATDRGPPLCLPRRAWLLLLLAAPPPPAHCLTFEARASSLGLPGLPLLQDTERQPDLEGSGAGFRGSPGSWSSAQASHFIPGRGPTGRAGPHAAFGVRHPPGSRWPESLPHCVPSRDDQRTLQRGTSPLRSLLAPLGLGGSAVTKVDVGWGLGDVGSTCGGTWEARAGPGRTELALGGGQGTVWTEAPSQPKSGLRPGTHGDDTQ